MSAPNRGRQILAIVLAFTVAAPVGAFADPSAARALAAPSARHVVSLSDAMARLGDVQRDRTARIQAIDDLLATPQAAKQAQALRADIGALRRAVPTLSNDELNDLSQRVQKLRQDPVAGWWHHDEEFILLIVLLVLVLVVVLVASNNSNCNGGCY